MSLQTAAGVMEGQVGTNMFIIRKMVELVPEGDERNAIYRNTGTSPETEEVTQDFVLGLVKRGNLTQKQPTKDHHVQLLRDAGVIDNWQRER